MKRLAAAFLLSLLLSSAAVPAPSYGEGQVAELLAVAVAEQEPERRRAQAIRALEHTELRTHLPALRRLLREERSLDIRLAAACTLAALGDRKSPADLLLVTAYDQERTPSCTRSDVVLALARTGNPAAVLHLRKALEAPAPADEPFFYADACRALSILGTPEALAELGRALREGSAEVRHAAVTPLANAARTLSVEERAWVSAALLYRAREDAEPRVAEQAMSGLFWCGVDASAFFRLLEADPEPEVRARAARVMNRHYLRPRHLERLRAALATERDAGVRTAIEETLRSQERGDRVQ
ncbi:MAG: HEAT repeat domain-containing protein [Armatimonadota bacterium]